MEQILCFKHRRRVARDNTVKFRRHTLQLLPSQQRRSHAGAVVVVLQELDGRLSLQHKGRIIASQDAPPSPGALRNGQGPAAHITLPPPDREGLADAPASVPGLLKAKMDGIKEYDPDVDGKDVAAMTVSASPGKPTFLQRERWKAVQRAKRRGLSIRGMARELGIHRDTVRRYIDAEIPPTRRSPTSTSDTITEYVDGTSAEQLAGYFPELRQPNITRSIRPRGPL